MTSRGRANRGVAPPVVKKSVPSARVLIFAGEPWIFQALRVGLGATEERRGPSGRYYDQGQVQSPGCVWEVALPFDVDDENGVETCFEDQKPSFVIFVEETPTYDLLRVPGRVWFGDGKKISGSAEAPRHLFDLLKRVAMRGQWPDSRGTNHLAPSDEWRTTEALPTRVFVTAERRRCPAIVVLVAAFAANEPRWFGQGVDALLSNITPDMLVASDRASRPVVAPAPPKIDPIPVRGSVSRIEMRSVRMFEHLAWTAPEARSGWHVVLGNNASGKTSLLRALALCLLDRSEREALRQSWSTWLRSNDPHGEVTVALQPDEESAAATDLTLTLRRVAPTKPGDPSTVDVMSLERLVHAGFLAAYGPFRRFTGGDAEWVKGFKEHPRLQRVLTLFDERAALSDAIEWLKDLWVRARTITPTPPEAAFLKDLLEFINTTEFLPDGVVVEEPDADGVWCRDGNGLRVLVIDLSDGYRSVLSLALDLLRHLAAEYGHAQVFERSPELRVAVRGVVLIDEVDAHLHPSWQQRIGAWFKRCFPNVQFITATHSAIVCQSADSVLLLPTPGSHAEPRMATRDELNRLRYGNVLDAYGTGVFGVGVEQSVDGRARLDRLAALNVKELDEGLSPEEETERGELRAMLPSRAGAVRRSG